MILGYSVRYAMSEISKSSRSPVTALCIYTLIGNTTKKLSILETNFSCSIIDVVYRETSLRT